VLYVVCRSAPDTGNRRGSGDTEELRGACPQAHSIYHHDINYSNLAVENIPRRWTVINRYIPPPNLWTAQLL